MSGAADAMPQADLFGRAVASSSKSKQLPLPLTWCRSASEGGGDFLVSNSNEIAAHHLQRFAQWAAPATILAGPHGSGKTLLAQLFVAASAGEAVELSSDVGGDIRAKEAALFHAWNRAHSSGKPLLIVCDATEWIAAIELADLRTRLATAPVVVIGDPDLSLAAALIERLLTARGLAVPPSLGASIAARIERSYCAIHAAVAVIDAAVMASRRPLGTRMALAALLAAGLLHEQERVVACNDAAIPSATA